MKTLIVEYGCNYLLAFAHIGLLRARHIASRYAVNTFTYYSLLIYYQNLCKICILGVVENEDVLFDDLVTNIKVSLS